VKSSISRQRSCSAEIEEGDPCRRKEGNLCKRSAGTAINSAPPKIVEVLGIFYERDEKKAIIESGIVMKLMSKGSLKDFIYSLREKV